MNDRYRAEYEQGCQACFDFYQRGIETRNPYPEWTDEYLAFEAGWGDEKMLQDGVIDG